LQLLSSLVSSEPVVSFWRIIHGRISMVDI